eukprot:Tamp_23400.p1 GENE.Tamp_23400~~Tamp_23400.p1  ORF type:complete len:245 (+),score=41.96 Tamp_23400:39-737(+)
MLAAAVLLLGAPAVGCFAPYPRVPVLRGRSAPAVTRPGARTPFAAQSREVSVALPATAGDGGEQFDIDAFDAEVQRRNGEAETPASAFPAGSGATMDATELRRLVVAKWGKPYDTRIHRRRDAFQQLGYYLQVMWKHAEQQSFHLTDAEYMEQLEAVSELISEWGLAEYVREQIRETKQRPGIGVGRGPVSGAVCVSIPLVREEADGTLHAITDDDADQDHHDLDMGYPPIT